MSAVEYIGSSIRIRLRAYDHIERLTVNCSLHADKKYRKQFETRTHTRLIDIKDCLSQTVDALTKFGSWLSWIRPIRH